jgi:hypothetical protein
MKIVCHENAGQPAIGVQLEDGVLPTGYSDLRTFLEAGPRELDRFRAESPRDARPGSGGCGFQLTVDRTATAA